MTESEDNHLVGGRIEMVERDIAAVAEADDEFAQLRRVRDGTPDRAVGFKQSQMPADFVGGAFGGGGAAAFKKPSAAVEARPGRLGDNQLRQGPSAVSSPVPQRASHSSVSAPV